MNKTSALRLALALSLPLPTLAQAAALRGPIIRTGGAPTVMVPMVKPVTGLGTTAAALTAPTLTTPGLVTPTAPLAPSAEILPTPGTLESIITPAQQAVMPADLPNSLAVPQDTPEEASGKAGKAFDNSSGAGDDNIPAPAAGVSEAGNSLPVTTFKLKNGLTVVVQTDKTSPIVAVSVTYKVGSQHESRGLSGFAHLFEHLMAQGTKSLKPREISHIIESRGGVRNAYTMKTNTTYHSLIPRQHLKTVLWAEAERMDTLNVDERALALEKQVVLEEMRQSYLNKPYRKAQDAGMAEQVFGKWENQHTTIGDAKDVRDATLEDVRAFYRAHYAPNNAVIALAGDISAQEARVLVEQYFGGIAPHEVSPAPDLTEAPLTREKRAVIEDPLAKLPRLMAAWQLPPRGTKDYWALTLLAEMLSGGEASPLYQAVVKSGKLALGASMNAPWWSNHYNANGPDAFGFILSMKQGKAPEAALALADAVLARFGEQGPTAEELDRAKVQTELQWIEGMQSLLDRAKILSSYAALIGDPTALAGDLASLLAVTAQDVKGAVGRWITGKGRAVVTIVPGKPVAAEDVVTPPIPAQAPRPEGEKPPAPEASKEISVPALSRFTLVSGLKVVFIEDRRLPLLEARLVLRAGRTAEGAGKEGVSTAVRALLLKGAGAQTGAQIAEKLTGLGYSLDVNSGAETMSVAAQGLARNAEAFFRQLALVLSDASYPESELALWKENMSQKLKELQSDPGFLSGERLGAELFGTHAYGRSTPTEAQLSGLGREDLVSFLKSYVTPGNGTLVVAGPMTAAEGQAMLEEALSGWTGKASAIATPKAPQGGTGLALVDRPGSSQASLTLAQAIPLTPKHPDYLAFVVMNQILGGSATSRLFVNLRVDKGYTYGAYARLSAFDDLLLWTAEAEVRNEVAKPARAEMLKEIDRMREELVPVETLEATKRYLAGLFLMRLASSDMTADVVAKYERDGLDPAKELAAYLKKLEALTPEELRRVARLYLDPSRMVQVVVGDASRLENDLR